VYWIAKDLAQGITFSKGKERVRVVLFDYHWERWFTELEQKPLRTELSKKLLGEDYGGRFYTLGERYEGTYQPENAEENDILMRLKTNQQKQLAEIARQIKDQKSLAVNESLDTPLALEKGRVMDPKDFAATNKALFEIRTAPGEGNYYYYQPVYWQNVCETCHVYDKFLLSPSTKAATSEELPFRAVRVTLLTLLIADSSRARAVGILTVFLSMVACGSSSATSSSSPSPISVT
jgi:hypothetical protein